MTPRHWLIKFAPFRTSWAEIVARGIFTPRGIRNPEARKHLSAMRLGDPVLFYRSQQDQTIIGILEVTVSDSRWSCGVMVCAFVAGPSRSTPVGVAGRGSWIGRIIGIDAPNIARLLHDSATSRPPSTLPATPSATALQPFWELTPRSDICGFAGRGGGCAGW